MQNQLVALVISLMVTLMANAQSKTEILSAGNDNVIQCITNRGDSGFIISTGNAKFRGDVKITYYNQHLHKNWEYNVKQGDVIGGGGFFVASESTEYIYWMNSTVKGPAPSAERTISLFRFNEEGFEEKFSTEIEEINENVELLHVFSDKKYLYYFTAKQRDITNEKSKEVEQLFMYTMGHDKTDFRKTNIDLDLKTPGQLSVIGHTDSFIYVCQKRIVKITTQIEIEIFKINKNGEVVDNFTIQPKNTQFYVPFDVTSNRDLKGDYNINYETATANFNNTFYASGEPNGLLTIELDAKHNQFCIYGMTAKKRYPRNYDLHISKIFIATYTLAGEVIKLAEIPIVKSKANLSLLKTPYYSRHLYFTILSKDTFRFDFDPEVDELAQKTTTYFVVMPKIVEAIKTKKPHPIKTGFSAYNRIKFKMICMLNSSKLYSLPSFYQYGRSHNIKKNHFAFTMGKKMVLLKTKSNSNFEILLFE